MTQSANLFLFWRVGAIVEYLNRRASLVGSATFFDERAFPWVADVEAEWRAIRTELDQLLSERERIPNLHDISEEHRSLSEDDRWKIYVMVAAGSRIEANCRRCPRTMAAVERIPGLSTAIFSILGPGKHIHPHRGYFNGLLRYHLALLVPGPPDACRIRVGEETRTWEEGRSLIFDDTNQHEAWNESNSDRVVLYVDFLRPMRFPMSALSKAFVAVFARPFVREGERKIREWEDRYTRRAAGPPGPNGPHPPADDDPQG